MVRKTKRKAPEPADLPDNLSDLLELSVQDAVQCYNSPDYKLDMGTWVRPNGACKVCMAGAVMVQTGNWTGGVVDDPSDEFKSEDDFDSISDAQRYYAINDMRDGDFCTAADKLDIQMPDEVEDAAKKALGMKYDPEWNSWSAPDAYDRRGGRFTWLQYLKAAEVLRENGF